MWPFFDHFSCEFFIECAGTAKLFFILLRTALVQLPGGQDQGTFFLARRSVEMAPSAADEILVQANNNYLACVSIEAARLSGRAWLDVVLTPKADGRLKRKLLYLRGVTSVVRGKGCGFFLPSNPTSLPPSCGTTKGHPHLFKEGHRGLGNAGEKIFSPCTPGRLTGQIAGWFAPSEPENGYFQDDDLAGPQGCMGSSADMR
eukprot:EG_transcript_27734